MYDYRITNASKDEEKFIHDTFEYIQYTYPNKLKIERLKEVKIVDKLSSGASGRAIRDKIFLARENGLDILNYKTYNKLEMDLNDELKDLISTIYHELWHISTWEKYEYMYEFVLDESTDDITAYAYMYWIEYIGHTETVFMEVQKVMMKFCSNFVNRKWHKLEFVYFIKALPYYLIRSQYLSIYNELTPKIECKKLREAVYEFDKISRQLLDNGNMNDIQKANIIKEKIKKLFD